MDDIHLSPRERIILQDIERVLRRDRRFTKAMRPPHPPRHPARLPFAVAVLAAVSVLLIVVGIRTSRPEVIWAFAAVWPITLLLAFRLLRRLSRRRELG